MEQNQTTIRYRVMMGLPVFVLVAAVAGLALTTSAAPAGKGDPEAGKKLYEQFCLSCHGATGRGDGPTGQFLPVKPTDYAKSMPQYGDKWAEYYFKIIKEGGVAMDPPRSPLMAPWGGQLKESDIWDVISYVEILSKGNP